MTYLVLAGEGAALVAGMFGLRYASTLPHAGSCPCEECERAACQSPTLATDQSNRGEVS